VEDLATAHLEFAQGGRAELVSVWHNILGRPSTRRLELFFENGMFATEHDFFGPIQFQLQSDPPQTLSEDEVRRRYLEVIALRDDQYEQALARYSLADYFFLKALSDGSEPFPDFALALEAHRLVDAIYRSAAAGGEQIALA
jgi:predicted dehydrogenase